MNISKKLKLSLLATSILFFPKAGHTMMTPEDKTSSAGPSIQAHTPDQERPVFNSLLPVGLSNQVPTPSTDYRAGSNRMKQLFGQAFIPNERINQQLTLLGSTSPENFQEITEAIRTQLVEKFTTSNTYSSRSSTAIDPVLLASLQDVVSFALTLSKEEIEQRSKGMIRTIVDLNNAFPSFQHTVLPSFLCPQTEEEVDRSYNVQLSELLRRTPNLLCFFKDLLKLDPRQITYRTEVIKKSAGSLLPNRPYTYIKEWEEKAFSIMEFLLKLKTQDIIDRAESMKKLMSFSSTRDYEFYTPVKQAAALLGTSTLMERADEFLNLLNASPALELIANKLSYLAVELNPVDFRHYVASQNSQTLLINLHHSYSCLDPLTFIEQIKSELAVAAPSSSSSAPTSSSSSIPSVQPANPADELALQASATKFQMGEPNSYQTTGFSAFEGSHRWTVGNKASITLPLAEMKPRPSSISFLNTKGLITPTHSQTLTVKVNRKLGNRYVYTPGNNNHTLEIPLPKDGPVVIQFEISNAASPSALGINADKRELGISFGEVQFQY
ncbi:MAG: hypothetical protein K2X02_03115 [Alphaproteobacteria bacterium]|nr:hypothetical protein [Alphaproteobacteria bacterium]